ncbi:MAG: hypothetical protein C4290_01650 [Chloroflexota bacterium]
MQRDRPADVTAGETAGPASLVSHDTIQRAIARDPAAFTELYEAHVARIYRHVRYRVGDADAAEDITAQVFLRAWQAIHRYRPQAGRPFIAWLFTIANNLIVDHHRRTRQTLMGIEGGRYAAATLDPEEAALSADLHAQIAAALRRLKPEYQLIIALRLIEDMDYDAIARVLGKKPGALRVTFFRALNALRAELTARGIQP